MPNLSPRSVRRSLLRAAGLFFACLLSLLNVSVALAADEPPTFTPPKLEIPIPNVSFSQGVSANEAITLPWIGQYVSGIYTFLISIVGLVAAVMIIVGGFQYITSGGDKSKVEKGKKHITDAIIGLVLTFGSYILLYTINPNLVSFNGLQLASVRTVQYGDITDGNSEPPPPGTPTEPGNIDVTQRICSSVSDCLPYCRKAGCTTISTYGRADYMPASLPGFEGVTLKPIGRPFDNDCNRSVFPPIAGADRNPIPDIPHIKANGNGASQQVIDGLRRASQYIDQKYPGQDIVVNVSNCYRDPHADFGAQCAIIMRATNNDPHTVSNGSTWPGSNPHASGYACDLSLVEGGRQTSCTAIGDAQYQCQFKSGDDKLVDIITNPAVGGKRLSYECWHFEFASPYDSRCQGSECTTYDDNVRTRKNITCP